MKIGILFEGNFKNPGGFNQSLASALILKEFIIVLDCEALCAYWFVNCFFGFT